MANTIKPKRSYTASATPTLAAGELGVNAADKKTWIGNAAGSANVLIASLSLSDMTGSTTNITEGTNLYYTDARARAALSSSATGLSYNSSTGAFSFTAGYSIPATSDQTNWTTAYTNRITSLTTTGSSGAATLSSNTLNIPTYTLAGLGGQASSTNLTSLSGLTFSSTSFVKMTGSGTFALDTSTYLTSNQSITLSGDASGSGSTAITVTLATVGATKGGTGQTTYTTGDILYSSAANTLSKLSGNTTTTKQFLSQVGTGLASQAPSWSVVSKSDVGLGSVENTALSTWAGTANITTLGTVATGTWNATAIGLSKGGTNASITATNGGIIYSTASALAVTSAGTSGQILQSNGAAAPTWVASPGVPTGSLFPFAGSSASVPSGYLLCDGSAVARTGTYAALFAVIGTTYGSGNGSTTFNLPDLRSRLPIGAGTGTGLTNRVAGTTYGTETHTLVSANIPQMTTGNMSANASHAHGHVYPVFVNAPTTGGSTLSGSGYVKGNDSAGVNPVSSTSTEHTHTVGNQSPTAVNHLPPTLAVNYIIKT